MHCVYFYISRIAAKTAEMTCDEGESEANPMKSEEESDTFSAIEVCTTTTTPGRKRHQKLDYKLSEKKFSISKITQTTIIPAGSLDEDELFFQSLLPSFRQLSPP